MNKYGDTFCMLFGAVTATAVGTVFLQALGAIILGILGAAGGYVFNHYLKQHLDALVQKLKGKGKS